MFQFDLPAFTPGYLDPWLEIMARLHTPATTSAWLTGEPLDAVSRIYASVGAACGSVQPDKTPAAWFAATTNRRYHGAVIASLFGQVKSLYPGAIGCAILHCYSYYSRLADGGGDDALGAILDLNGDDTRVLISFTKSVDLLRHLYGLDEGHLDLQPSLQVVKCRRCGSLFIDEMDPPAADEICPLCQRGFITKLLDRQAG